MNKLVLDGERASADSVNYGDLVYVMEKLNQLIDRIQDLESYVRRTGTE